MAKDAREQRPTEDEDRDQVDFTWLVTLFRRLGRRIFPADDPPPLGGDGETTTAERPEEQSAAAPPVVVAEEEVAPARPVGATPIVRFRRALAGKKPGSPEWAYGVPLAIALLVGVVSIKTQFGGVDWGDDWALYVHQAKALVVGNVGEVLRETRFTVDNSGASSFSPYSYPWGWPLLMAPVYAAFGLDYGALKFLEVVALGVFLLAFFAIVRRRAGMVPATILTLLIGVSRAFNGATDTVLSDLPHLCFAGLTLWWMDRCRARGLLSVDRRALVILGLLLAFTTNIRREGFVLVAPLIALHLTLLAGAAVRSRSVQALRAVDWRKLSLPYITYGAAVVGFHLVLPRAIKPDAPGAGLANIRPRLTYYRDVLAEHVGLKDPGATMQLFHSETAARFALNLLVIVAVVGLVGRLLHRFEEDVHLATFLVCTSFVMLVSPFQESRYLFTITPFLLYFAYQALPSLAELGSSRKRTVVRFAAIPSTVAALGLVMLCGSDLKHALDYHRTYHYTINGPETPDAKQMFAVVKEVTRGDDVILFARARVMTLYTDRSAIQGSNLELLLPRSDWYVMEKNSTYWQTPLSDADAAARRLKKAWENGTFVIWQVPPRGT